MKQRPSTGGLVYSTDAGRMCPACRRPVGQCICGKAAPAPAGDGIVRVQRETKGRGGKAVTVVRGAPGDAAALVKLGQELKAACGSGGTVKDGTIEVQGDHVDKVIALLQQRRHIVKRVGG
jgi:translation initiation factor 1